MSSPLILSLSTVFALIGIVLVAIAFGTNNWSEYHVNRAAIFGAIARNTSLRLHLSQVNTTDIYYDRTYGLFRECFPTQVPNNYGTYLSPLGATCVNIRDYQIPEDTSVTETYTDSQKTRMQSGHSASHMSTNLTKDVTQFKDDPKVHSESDVHSPWIVRVTDLMRACVAFYIVGLVFLFICLFTGVTGCWRRSTGLILTTGILLLFSTLFLAASMAVWHGIEYLEREVIDVAPFFKTWHPVLQANTEMTYGWSYVISWVGIAFVLISSVLMLAAYRAMKEEERDEFERKRAPYMMPNYYEKAMMPYAGQQPYGGYQYGYPANAYYGNCNYASYGNGGYNGYYLTYGR